MLFRAPCGGIVPTKCLLGSRPPSAARSSPPGTDPLLLNEDIDFRRFQKTEEEKGGGEKKAAEKAEEADAVVKGGRGGRSSRSGKPPPAKVEPPTGRTASGRKTKPKVLDGDGDADTAEQGVAKGKAKAKGRAGGGRAKGARLSRGKKAVEPVVEQPVEEEAGKAEEGGEEVMEPAGNEEWLQLENATGEFKEGDALSVISASGEPAPPAVSVVVSSTKFLKARCIIQIKSSNPPMDGFIFANKILGAGAKLSAPSGGAVVKTCEAEWHNYQPWALHNEHVGKSVRRAVEGVDGKMGAAHPGSTNPQPPTPNPKFLTPNPTP